MKPRKNFTYKISFYQLFPYRPVTYLLVSECPIRCQRKNTALDDLNTLRTGDADLRFYVKTVQDG